MPKFLFTENVEIKHANNDGTIRPEKIAAGTVKDLEEASIERWERRGKGRRVDGDTVPVLPGIPEPEAPAPSGDDGPVAMTDEEIEEVTAALEVIRDDATNPQKRRGVYNALRTIDPFIDALSCTDDSKMVLEAAAVELGKENKITTMNWKDIADAARDVVGS